MTMPSGEDTIVALMRARSLALGDKLAFANLKDGLHEERRLSFGTLRESCLRVGAALQKRGVAGERVLLLFPQGAEFVVGFFSTLHAGAIAVPAHTPKPAKRSWATFEAIVADCAPRLVLTCRAIRDNIAVWREPYPSLAALDLVCVEDLEAEALASEWTEPTIAPGSIAFLQYTSGSTSAPKGVMVSHENLLHNAALTARHMGHDEKSVIVSWLPLFHDLGLIGIVVQTLWSGATCFMMSPAAFSGNPALWLQAISRHRATTSMSSDFGYRLCSKGVRPEQLEGVDLSSWRNALNAAEPIHASTLRDFEKRFGPHGFSPTAFFPAYGLAEATLLSTTSRVGEKPVVLAVDKAALGDGRFVPDSGGDGVALVSSGRPASDMEILIVDPDTRLPVPPGAIGEIWVRGKSIAAGYWNAPDATAATFRQSPADRDAPEFLRTGDLGFLWEKELFVAGRLKDLIVVRGRNIHPQDVELSVKDCHPAFRTVNGAAFSVDGTDGEAVVVVHEIERTARNTTDLARLADTVREAVFRDHDARVADVVFLPPASLPKTTSGKVQRRLAKALYLKGELPTLRQGARAAEAANAASSAETRIVAAVASVLALAEGAIRAEQTFGAIGMDSVSAAQLAKALGEEFGRPLEPTVFWEFPTPALLARHLAGDVPASAPKPAGRSLLHALRAALGEPALEKQE